MAGRRIVDAAKLFSASKSIARKHIALRSQQLDAYSKTSSLAKAVKSQTDRVTLTAQAAIILAQRLNEDRPRAQPTTASQTAGESSYRKEEDNVRAAPPSKDGLGVRQEKAESTTLPDGTISSGRVAVEEDGRGQDTFAKRPVQETPKRPLAQQKEDEGIKPLESDASTIPTPSEPEPSHLSADKARKLQRQFEAQIPSSEDIIQTPSKDAGAEKLAQGHDQDVFYSRSNETPPEPSSLPRTKIPKHAEDKQESDVHVEDRGLNQDVYYQTPAPETQPPQREQIPHEVAVPEQDQVPEGINTDVFRTKRVAKMLGGNPYAPKPQLDLKKPTTTPTDHTKVAEGHDQDTFNVHTTKQSKPSTPEQSQSRAQPTTEKEMHDFASELAKDVNAAPSPVSEVRSPP